MKFSPKPPHMLLVKITSLLRLVRFTWQLSGYELDIRPPPNSKQLVTLEPCAAWLQVV